MRMSCIQITFKIGMSGKQIPPPCRTIHLTGEMMHGAIVSPVSNLSLGLSKKHFSHLYSYCIAGG